MELALAMIEHIVYFGISSIPLIAVYFCLKVFKLSPKVTLFFWITNLLMSVFFWFKVKDIFLTFYQCVPYVSSLIWIWCENVMRKRNENNQSVKESSDLSNPS